MNESPYIESQFYKRLGLMPRQRAKDLCRIKLPFLLDKLVDVVCHEGQLECQRPPIAGCEKEKGQEAVTGSLWQYIGIQPIDEVDGIQVVGGQILKHYREEDLRKEKCDLRKEDKEEEYSAAHIGIEDVAEASGDGTNRLPLNLN